MRTGHDGASSPPLDRRRECVDRHIRRSGTGSRQQDADAQRGIAHRRDGNHDAHNAQQCEQYAGDTQPKRVDDPPGQQHGGQSSGGHEEQHDPELRIAHTGVGSQQGQGGTPHTPESAESGEAEERRRTEHHGGAGDHSRHMCNATQVGWFRAD